MTALGREHVFAVVESCLSPGHVLQRQLTARLLTDSELSANGGKGREVRVQQTLWMSATLSKLPLRCLSAKSRLRIGSTYSSNEKANLRCCLCLNVP